MTSSFALVLTDGARRRSSWFAAIVAALWLGLALALALAWLAFPYSLNGRHLLGDAGFSVQAERMDRSTATARLLVRLVDGAGEAEIDALYATAEYLDLVDPSGAAQTYQPGRYLVFVVNETTHISPLPTQLPRAILRLDGHPIEPVDVNGPTDVRHHRTTIIRFPLRDANGRMLLLPTTQRLDLQLTSTWNRGQVSTRIASWDLPIAYPPGTASRGLWSFALIMSLSAGLLSAVLTPCLLQLVVVYLATLASMPGPAPADGPTPPASGLKPAMAFSAAFVAGFTLLYTLAGALIGHLGHQAQILFASIDRPAGIVAGVVIILLALWTARQSRVPLACRLPAPGVLDRLDRGGLVRAGLTAATFSLGCITCFGGAIVGTLLVYVGSIGSAAVGGAIMFAFSAGIAIPFLAAAVAVSRASQMTAAVMRSGPWAGLIGSAVMAAFGLVLITNSFHTLSDFLYPYLRLPA